MSPTERPSKHLADRDLARRSKLSGLVYLALYGIIIAFTPYAHDHGAMALLVSAVIVVAVACRSWLIFRFEKLYSPGPNRWLIWFSLFTLLLAGTWGMFCAHALFRYGLGWTAMLALLSTAGISAGAITTLSIHRNLIMPFLALLLLPPTAVAAFLHTRESFAITLMFLTYCAFMFNVARNINKEYWKALDNVLLLDQRARELEASNQELESYSYSIAHDLRTPLRSIIGFSQILKEELYETLAPSERNDLARIIDAGKHMAKLIDDLLELSRITRRDLEPREIDLSALVQAQADALTQHEPGRPISFRIQPGLRVQGDARLLNIALHNLMENAWKFTRDNDLTEIVFGATNKDNETIYRLCDNGVGFDMAHAGKLFKPFERLHNHGEFAGTGVGLATAQRIILRHGGRIWAEASLGKGACFYFTLSLRSQ
jgi:signal transduction histidine kinase